MKRFLPPRRPAEGSSGFPLWRRRRYGGASEHWRAWLVLLAALAAVAVIHDFPLPAGRVFGSEAARPVSRDPLAPGESPGAKSSGALRSEDSASRLTTNGAAAETAGDGQSAEPGGEPQGHADPVAKVLAAIVLILLLAKVGGDLFERFGMPAVLGELAFGIVLGNLPLLTGPIAYLFTGTFEGWHGLDFVKPPEAGTTDLYSAGAAIKILAGIGVVLLLFEVGLESSVKEMLSVGASSMLVAVLGVVAPMALGYAATVLVVKGMSWTHWEVPAFVGATLCATSVGITARVLKDLGRSQQTESRIILGAAVVDDVLGLLVLAVVSGAIMAAATTGGGSAGLGFKIFKTIVLAVGFLFGALLLGRLNFPRAVFRVASLLRGHGLLVATSLMICFGFSWLANVAGLATIVGAFAAGLILEGTHYQELGRRENRSLEEALAPLSAVLVPIFFVQMGIQVQLDSFRDPDVWLLAGAITLVAIVGKQVCAFGVREKGLNRVAVGLGMIPRGEVGLIFANEGQKLFTPGGERIIDHGTYSAVVVMVMITTMVTPPLLKWSLMSGEAPREAGEEA